jgi:hypothetical protein
MPLKRHKPDRLRRLHPAGQRPAGRNKLTIETMAEEFDVREYAGLEDDDD